MKDYSELVKRLRDPDSYTPRATAADAIAELQKRVVELTRELHLKHPKPVRSAGAVAWDEACESVAGMFSCRYDKQPDKFRAVIDRLGEQLPPRPVKTGGRVLCDAVAPLPGATWDRLTDCQKTLFEDAARELGIEPQEC